MAHSKTPHTEREEQCMRGWKAGLIVFFSVILLSVRMKALTCTHECSKIYSKEGKEFYSFKTWPRRRFEFDDSVLIFENETMRLAFSSICFRCMSRMAFTWRFMIKQRIIAFFSYATVNSFLSRSFLGFSQVWIDPFSLISNRAEWAIAEVSRFRFLCEMNDLWSLLRNLTDPHGIL